MTRFRACFHFDIGELFVRRGELGASYQLRADPLVRLGLPGADPPFVLAVDRHGDREDPFTGSILGSVEHPPELVGVSIVQVNVEFEADLSSSEFVGPSPDDALVDKALKVWDSAYEKAQSSYEQFREWARVAGDQYWIGMAHDEPRFAGIQTLEDLQTGERIPVGYPRIEGAAAVFSRDARERMPLVADIVDAMAPGHEPPIAATLLADARAIYWPARRTGRDHQRAVLLAAIACEVEVKERLRQLAAGPQARLLEVIVANPRDVTQSVPQLLRDASEAITGCSLFKDDRQLWNGIERLFQVRNRVAHRGHVASAKEAQEGVAAAVRLFAWLSERA
jgi:hypothetical protein